MAWWRSVGGELSALGTLALSMPLDLLLPHEPFDPMAPHPTPVVFVHGLGGAASNFLALRTFLGRQGIRNFASLSYGPRVDYQRVAPRLGRLIETVCRDARTPAVDVVGHSLGGLVARYLVELGNESRVRRLVTLGAPYYGERRPSQELAVFAADDALVPPPADTRNGVMVVENCGHLNLLRHPAVLRAVACFLRTATVPSSSTAREAA